MQVRHPKNIVFSVTVSPFTLSSAELVCIAGGLTAAALDDEESLDDGNSGNKGELKLVLTISDDEVMVY